MQSIFNQTYTPMNKIKRTLSKTTLLRNFLVLTLLGLLFLVPNDAAATHFRYG